MSPSSTNYLLQFCGLSDPLQLFYLQQKSNLCYGGFRPCQLDDLLEWSQAKGGDRGWDLEAIQKTVVDVWMERADVIRQWQLRLWEEPSDCMLVAGIGTPDDWEQHCEELLRA